MSRTLIAAWEKTLRRCGDQDRIFLIEKGGRFGAGLAYATGNSNHLLNVRAGNMSAFSGEPDHFVNWLQHLPKESRALIEVDPPNGSPGDLPGRASFAPRGLFGAYMQQSLAEEIWRGRNGERLTVVNDEAVGIERTSHGLAVKLEVGRHIVVDEAVLAIGNFPPARGEGPVYGYVHWPSRIEETVLAASY